MLELLAKLEALLFVSGKPMSYKVLAKSLGLKGKDNVYHKGMINSKGRESALEQIKKLVNDLQQYYKDEKRGLSLIITETSAQLFTAPALQELVKDYLEVETHADLTRPQLETLSIIAYRDPIIKESLEQIRGVNCSIILHNLMIRGLVVEQETSNGLEYAVTEDFLSHLGVGSISELPNYKDLHTHDHFNQL